MSRTAPQTPNSIFTPSAITVATSTGFNQGDLVYQSNTGNFGRIPDNAISSDTFNITQNSPILAAPNSGSVIASNSTGSSYGISAATLTNGNIVSVYVAQTANNVAFKITDVNNTEIVAQTIVSTVFRTNWSNVSVAALSGGGFVVTWINTLAGGTTNSVCYAVYTNTGAVTLAAAQDLTLGSGTFTGNSYLSYALALPNGTFVLAAPNASNAGRYRIYNADGTGAYVATTATGTYVPSFQMALAARSDSSFIIAGTTGSTTVGYFIISATNTAITNASFTSTLVSTSFFGLSVACLTNGTTFVIGYAGTNASANSSAYRFLPTGNVLSSETLFTTGISTSTSQPFNSVTVQSLASGNFILLASEFAGLINYAVFNSSGVCISGATAGTPIPKRIWAGQVTRTGNWNTVIVTSSSINVYWTYATALNSNAFGLVQSLVRLNLNTYDPIPVIGSTNTIATTTAGVSGYNTATATPTNARFSAASNSILTSTQAMGFVRNETVISSAACFGLHAATLMNGNFVVAYVSSSAPYPITAAIYTPSGTLITSFNVSATGVNLNSNVKVAALSGGGFVVTYATGASNPLTLNNAVYTSSGSLVGTSIVTANGYLDSSTYGFSVSGITNNRFVVLYSQSASSNLFYRVFDSLGVALTSETNTSYTGTLPSVAAYSAGGFVISYFSTNQTFVRFNETATNTFSAAVQYAFSNSSNVSYSQVAVNSNNQASILLLWPAAGASIYATIPYDLSSNFAGPTTSATAGGTLSSSPSHACCFTAYGNVVLVNTTTVSFGAGFVTYPVGVNGNTSNITTTFGLTAGNYNSTTDAQVNLSPLYGNVVLFTYKDASNRPKFALFNATPYTQTQPITAGVTVSNGVQLSQQMGYMLAGVATTSATAGGTGLVQTNGVTTLNSNYNASTPAQTFDFQNNTGVGVKGTITGRNVTLQGNI